MPPWRPCSLGLYDDDYGVLSPDLNGNLVNSNTLVCIRDGPSLALSRTKSINNRLSNSGPAAIESISIRPSARFRTILERLLGDPFRIATRHPLKT